MKKLLLVLISLFAIGGGNLSAENHYLEIVTNSVKENAWEWAIWYQLDEPLESGKTYVLSMDAKCSEDFNLAFWPVNTVDGGKTLYTGYSVAKGWGAYSCEFVANDNLNRLSWNFGSLHGTLCFDNVKLVEKGETENLVKGGDFEEGLVSNWGNDGWNSPEYSIYESQSTSASRYLKMKTNSVKENAWEWAIWYQLDKPLESGKTYVLSMKAKCSEAYNMPFWPYKGGDGGGTNYTGYNIGTEWGECSCTFTAVDDLERLKWCFGSLNGTVYFDDIKLVEEGKTENLINDGSFDGDFLASNWGNDGWNKPEYALTIEYPAVSAIKPVAEIQLTKSMFKEWTGPEVDATISSNYPYWTGAEYGSNVGDGGVVYGNANVGYTQYADLSVYSGMKIYGTGSTLRILMNRVSDGGALTELRIVPTESGTFVDFSSYDYVHLNAIKVTGGTANVLNITLVDPTVVPGVDYVLSGDMKEGEMLTSVTSALSDASATVYDATGITGLGVELTPANPNAIFKANAGTLSNTKNVQVGNTIANLEIADGYPLADLTGATATAATYSRTMTNQFGTICLPYAVTSTASVKYYTIGSLDGDVLTLKEETELKAGTPAIVEIVEKVSGESITATGSGALAAAGAPTDNLKLIGTFEKKTIMASEYPDKKLYVISNNQFVQGTNSITVPAFRAYFTSGTSSGANIRLGFADEEVTAINKLAGEGGVTVKGIYSASGASVPALQKGLNLVEFSDGSVRKVIVK